MNVPFKDKDEIKALKGKWDKNKKKWYINSYKFDKNLYKKWLNKYHEYKINSRTAYQDIETGKTTWKLPINGFVFSKE